jgi:hypothetical protein
MIHLSLFEVAFSKTSAAPLSGETREIVVVLVTLAASHELFLQWLEMPFHSRNEFVPTSTSKRKTNSYLHHR